VITASVIKSRIIGLTGPGRAILHASALIYKTQHYLALLVHELFPVSGRAECSTESGRFPGRGLFLAELLGRLRKRGL